VFSVIAFFFDRFVILPTQITARIPLGKAEIRRLSRLGKRGRESVKRRIRRIKAIGRPNG